MSVDMLHRPLRNNGTHLYTYALIAMAIAGGTIAFPLSYVSNTNVVIGTCLLPFALFIEGPRRLNVLYLVVSVTCAILSYVFNVRIFYFFSIAFYVLVVIECSTGRTGSLLLFLLLFMSPFFEQVADILGFPVRLQLSRWAGSILSATGLNIQVEGNMMMVDGSVFTVDQACMGLHLLSTSFLMGIFILAHRYRYHKSQLSFSLLLGFFSFVLLLNLVANLFRICLLVTFKILPDDPMHQLVGLLCLVIYVVLPLYFLSNWLMKRYGKPFSVRSETRPLHIAACMPLSVLAFAIVWLGFNIKSERSQIRHNHIGVTMSGLHSEQIEGGVTKMTNEEMLVYVKPIPEFFSAEHTPLICWKGSGYKFEGITEIDVRGRRIYTGKLIREGESLYTAWWYDNGETSTISQLKWRMQMLMGRPDFCLVNVTTAEHDVLIRNLQSIFGSDLLTISHQ
jgi:exosortase N